MGKWIAVEVDEDDHARLKEQAQTKDLSLSQHVRRILKRAAKR